MILEEQVCENVYPECEMWLRNLVDMIAPHESRTRTYVTVVDHSGDA